MTKARATQGKTTKKGGSTITDIEHVPVPQPKITGPEQAVEVEAETLEMTIGRELKRFNLAESKIDELKQEYSGLTIADVNDKAGYDTVKRAFGHVRSVRTGLEKKGKEIRADYNAINKAVSAEEKRLIELVTPLEEELEGKIDVIDQEKRRLNEEAQAAEEKKLWDRIDALVAAGMTISSGYYQIGDTVSADVATIRSMPDDNFAKLLTAVKARKAELDEAQRVKDEEQERQQRAIKEQQEANEKLQRQLQEQREQQERAQQELQQQQEKLAEQKREVRYGRLEALGMIRGYHGITRTDGPDSVVVWLSDIDAATDEQFEKLLTDTATRIGDNKAAEVERQRQLADRRKEEERRKEVRSKILEEAGLSYNFGMDAFKFDNGFFRAMHSMQEIVAVETDQEVQVLADDLRPKIEQAKLDAIKRQEQQKQQAERLRKSKLGDSEKLVAYLKELSAVERPQMMTIAYQDLLNDLTGRLHSIINEYETIADKEAETHGS